MKLNHSEDHHHHHVVLLTQISLTLSPHPSLSLIASSRFLRLHPVLAQSCCRYVLAVCPIFAHPCEGVHRSTSLMSSSYFSTSIPHVWFILFGWFSWWVVGGRTAAVLWSVASRTCSIQLVAFLCNCHQAFSPYA